LTKIIEFKDKSIDFELKNESGKVTGKFRIEYATIEDSVENMKNLAYEEVYDKLQIEIEKNDTRGGYKEVKSQYTFLDYITAGVMIYFNLKGCEIDLIIGIASIPLTLSGGFHYFQWIP
jgi:hypothetical protein